MKKIDCYQTNDGMKHYNIDRARDYCLENGHLLLLEILKEACPYNKTNYKMSQDIIYYLYKKRKGDLLKKVGEHIKESTQFSEE